MGNSRYTMIRRIWLSSGIRRLMLGNTIWELRAVVDRCEEYLAFKGIPKDERRELEDWRKILLDEILRWQLEDQLEDRKRERQKGARVNNQPRP